MPFITLIVPVYNAEKFLRRCVNSILSSTFQDFELLLIDDGSTDSSGTICDEYKKLDSRIRVFHQKNGGVSSARNVGLENARGEWIMFVDSDDYLNGFFLSEILLFQNVDLVVLGVKFINKGVTFSPPRIEKMKIEDDLDFINEQLPKDYFLTPWAKFYKNSIITQNHLRFSPYLMYGEDTEFNLRYLLFIEYLGFSHNHLYYYNDADTETVLHKYVMSPEIYHKHLSLLLSSLDNLALKYKYPFPLLRGLLKGLFKYLLFSYLRSIQTYVQFKKEAKSFRKCNAIWYEKSRLKQSIKTSIIKYLPLLAYAYFRIIKYKHYL